MENKSFDNVAWLLDEVITNFCMSIVDDSVKNNADFHYKTGLRPKIIRITDGRCCEWCSKLAGSYDYEKVRNAGNDVFRRHRNCGCIVAYDPDDGTKRIQNAHNKQWTSEEDFEERIKLQELASDQSGAIADISSANDIETQSKKVDKLLNNYCNRESAWSGKTIVAKKGELIGYKGLKMPNCDIYIREDANTKTIIHEHLHARSISLYEENEQSIMLALWRGIEESSVELLSEEISKIYGIRYQVTYDQHINALRRINSICKIGWTDFDFAMKLFDIPLDARYTWLKGQVDTAVSFGRISKKSQDLLDKDLTTIRKDPRKK